MYLFKLDSMNLIVKVGNNHKPWRCREYNFLYNQIFKNNRQNMIYFNILNYLIILKRMKMFYYINRRISK